MLKSWSIQNFKPIVDSGELRLAPVTVLAGRNSSGKSSLIQSILMIAQTLSSRILDRALLPTGPVVQLGTFEDILSEQTGLRTLKINFELEVAKEPQKSPTRPGIIIDRILTGPSTTIKSVKVASQFRSPGNSGTSDSAIEASRVTIDSVSLEIVASRVYVQRSQKRRDELPLEFGVDIKQLSPKETEGFLKHVAPEYLRLVPYSTKDTNYLGTLLVKKDPLHARIMEPSLIAFSHFLPTRFVKKYAIEERRRSGLMTAVNLNLSYLGDDFLPLRHLSEFLEADFLVSQSLKDAIFNLCKDEGISKSFSGRTLADLILWYRSLESSKSKSNDVSGKLSEIITNSILETSIHAERANNKETEALETVTNNDTYIENIEKSIEQITQFFTSRIRYLGPLRADPQSAQKFSPTSELDDVGARGEYAAAVYEANQNARMRWYNPFSNKHEHSSLKTALNTWVNYLGVANEIKIQMAGQSGVSWQVVQTEGRKSLPLTAVGVGVSQVLPILVMGLLAPSNTLLLVEQPELHLHPSVQARLGDFFVGLSKCDKQCLVETHSENLISQLRYHIVQADEQDRSDCLIYFVSQDEQGAARFSPIEISAKGNILNWPDGFFDETMLQEDRITAASLKKRANETPNG